MSDLSDASAAAMSALGNAIDGVPSEPASTGTTPAGDSAPASTEAAPVNWENQYKELQPEYTRLTQRIAPLKELGDDVDMGEVAKAFQFYNALSNDPDYQLQVHQFLGNQLSQQGLLNQTPTATPEPTPDYGIDDSEVSPAVMQQLQELKSGLTQMQEEQRLLAFANQVARQEAAILDANKNYTEDDMARIYKLSGSFAGNLIEAQKYYEGMRQHFAAGLVQQSDAIPSQVAPVDSTPSETPLRIESTADATKAAIERLRQVFNS